MDRHLKKAETPFEFFVIPTDSGNSICVSAIMC